MAGPQGRTRAKDMRLPGPVQVAAAASTGWVALTLPADVRRQIRTMDLATDTARWYLAGTLVPIRWALVLPAGAPQGTMQVLLRTDLALEAAAVVLMHAQRWVLEATFVRVRARPGVETQCQWSALAVARTTPVLPGLFSLVTLRANRLHAPSLLQAQACASY